MELTVIVPVYNAEKVLNRCFESLKNQTNQDFFLILVNDGSQDNSLNICNEYVKANDNWYVYTIENSGPSGARNFGIEKATTKYITFIDADDFVDQNYIEELIKCVKDKDIQVGIVNYNEINGEKKSQHSIDTNYKNVIEFISFNYLWAPWGKIISRNIITKEFNKDYKIAEDIHFWIDNLYNKDIRFQFISSTCYNYTIDNPSITRTNNVGSNQISGLNAILDIITSTKDSLQVFFKKYYVSLFSKYLSKKMSIHIDKKYYDFYKLYYKELLSSDMGMQTKLVLFLKVKFPKLYDRLRVE